MQLIFFQIEHGHSMPEGKIRDFCDGSFFNNHPLFSANSKALQIMTYFDEFEVRDPLGSKASKHKMGLYTTKPYFYYSFVCFIRDKKNWKCVLVSPNLFLLESPLY